MIKRSDPHKLVSTALAEFHHNTPTVFKTAENLFFKSKYADLHSIKATCDPVLHEKGLIITQFPGGDGATPTLITSLIHVGSGEYMESETPLMLAKDDPQAQGSAITYMRRYAYCAILGIVTDPDDDGERAMRRDTFQSDPSHTSYERTETVNGQQIPAQPESAVTYTGPGGVDATPIGNGTDSKRIYAMSKKLDQGADVNDVCYQIIGHSISHTSQLTRTEYAQVLAELKRRGA